MQQMQMQMSRGMCHGLMTALVRCPKQLCDRLLKSCAHLLQACLNYHPRLCVLAPQLAPIQTPLVIYVPVLHHTQLYLGKKQSNCFGQQAESGYKAHSASLQYHLPSGPRLLR